MRGISWHFDLFISIQHIFTRGGGGAVSFIATGEHVFVHNLYIASFVEIHCHVNISMYIVIYYMVISAQRQFANRKETIPGNYLKHCFGLKSHYTSHH